MLYAVIDIGSNAARLLFANAYGDIDNIKIEKATLIRIPLRLGKDVFDIGKISKEKEKAFIKTMKAFKLLIDVYKPESTWACATAAMREASNSNKIVSKIKKETGISIEVISGAEEASIIRNTNRIVFHNPNRLTLFIDVGGGSTEISAQKNGELIKLKSFKVGTIRLLNNEYKKNIWDEINEWLVDFKDDFDEMNVVGSGGNINKINKIFGEKGSIFLSLENIENAYKTLSVLSIEDRKEKFRLRQDRADVIVPAAKIYLKLMDLIKAKHIAVPKIGLADGMVHELYREYLLEKNESLLGIKNE
jgi:exopolyphosphatase/guanosine-5'-triphosphate,3'-diphosphate pyrophosphatase